MVEYKEDSVYYTEVLYITAIYSFINTYFTSPAINHLKHTIQWFLVSLQSYVTTTTINLKTSSSPTLKKTSYPLAVIPYTYSLPLLSLNQLVIYSLSLYIFPF